MTTLVTKGPIPKRSNRRGVVSPTPVGTATIVPAGKLLGTKTVKVKKLRRPAAERILAIAKAAEAVNYATHVVRQQTAPERTEKRVASGSDTVVAKARKAKNESSKVINLDTFLKPVSGKKVVEAARRIHGYGGKELLKP